MGSPANSSSLITSKLNPWPLSLSACSQPSLLRLMPSPRLRLMPSMATMAMATTLDTVDTTVIPMVSTVDTTMARGPLMLRPPPLPRLLPLLRLMLCFLWLLRTPLCLWIWSWPLRICPPRILWICPSLCPLRILRLRSPLCLWTLRICPWILWPPLRLWIWLLRIRCDLRVDDDGFLESKAVIGLFVAGGGEEKKEEEKKEEAAAPAADDAAPAEEGGKKKKKKKKAAK